VEDAAVAHSALVASSIQGGGIGDLTSVLRTRGVFDLFCSAAVRDSASFAWLCAGVGAVFFCSFKFFQAPFTF
jgi:hypothetical protein